MTCIDMQGLECEKTLLRRPQRERRLIVIVLGVMPAAVACAILGLAFVQGSSWHYYGTDRALDRPSRARVETIRDVVDASGMVPEAVAWLDAALDPVTDSTSARTYLLAAQEKLKAAGDPTLAEAALELQPVIEAIRPTYVGATGTRRPVPALTWPW